ncbi:MAG: flagellar basal body P-ring formation protein FlgA [Rhodobiaceae bacterium]|nr:flagellar basal body P-ring formation protein FlgA [Rhodobiaceae bacterium]
MNILDRVHSVSNQTMMIARAAVVAMIVILVAIAATGARAQTSATRIVLRPAITVAGPIVHLGDLADGAGEHADVQLFRAPPPGTSGTVQAARIVDAIRRQGIELVETRGITQVVVTRSGREITREDVVAAIASELVHLGHARDAASLEIRLDPGFQGFTVENTARGPVRVIAIEADPRARRFSARVSVDGSTLAAAGVAVGGYAEEVAEVPTLSRPLQRGETVSPADIVIERIPVSLISADTVLSRDAVAGMAARRSIRSGKPLRNGDLMEPIIVHRDDVVAIVFERPGLVLSVRGRAVANGARGDVIAVTNLQSNRILQAEITGPGTVTVRATVARLAAATQ